MNILSIIEKKKHGFELNKNEIEFIVQGYSKGTIPDYQMSSLLMAIWFKGMNKQEISDLTLSMVNSGKIIDLSRISGIKVDKHSSGGVADTVTLPLVAIIAANNVPVAKMSGRGLGHTGGTIDKLESIPGFRVEIPIDEFIDIVNRVGGAIISQSEEVAIADKKIYALRDVTGTVDSIPLIASSIMSKKIASGTDAIVLDVKIGNGAFMQNLEDSIILAQTMVDIGTSLGKETVAYVTDMNEPLGDCIGNSIEVEEAINVLNGKGSEKLMKVIETLGAEILKIARKARTLEEGAEIIKETINNGSGLKKFSDIIKAQGGNSDVIYNLGLLPKAKYSFPIVASKEGFLAKVATKEMGLLASFLGAGRTKKEDIIDLSVGIVFSKKIGEKIRFGEEIGKILANSEEKANEALKRFNNLIEISDHPVKKQKVIYYRVDRQGVQEIT